MVHGLEKRGKLKGDVENGQNKSNDDKLTKSS